MKVKICVNMCEVIDVDENELEERFNGDLDEYCHFWTANNECTDMEYWYYETI